MLKPTIDDAPVDHHQFVKCIEALRTIADFQANAHLLTLDGDQTPVTLPPIVAADGGGEPTQVSKNGAGIAATVTFNDPDRTLAHLEGYHIRHYLIRLYYLWKVPEVGVGKTATQVVFTGGCMSCTRDGNLVTIRAMSKFALANHNPLEPYMVPKGTKITTGIGRLMSKGGDAPAHMEIQDNPRTLKDDFWVGHEGNGIVVGGATWTWGAKELASRLDYLAYERQDGAFVARKPPKTPEFFTFQDSLGGRNGFVTQMKVTRSFLESDGFCNRVVARWGKDLKEKPVIVTAPKSNPLAGDNPGMIRGGEPCFITKYVTFPDARKVTEVHIRCRDILRRALTEVTHVDATCFPFPFMEHGDIYKFNTQDYQGASTIGTWTLPLAGGLMTLGFNDFDVIGRI